MKIVIDAHIPYLRGVLDSYAEVEYVPAEDIDNRAIKDADVLIIRTPTKCTPALLKGSCVKFIMTASIGVDHIDTDYCNANGIMWRNSPGCNAYSVAQYVLSSLLLFCDKRSLSPANLTVGVVGVGNVGKAVCDYLSKAGFKLLVNDPPRAEQEGGEGFVSLDEIAEQCDVITLHTPLIKGSYYPTKHLANSEFFNKLVKKPLFINSARGGVTDDKALLQAKIDGKISDFVIDTWENEPGGIYTPLIDKAFIATSHIAGYSDDGKFNGSRTSAEEVAKYLGVEIEFTPNRVEPQNRIIDLTNSKNSLLDAVLHTYNPMCDFEDLKKNPANFETLRVEYPLRREFGAYKVIGVNEEDLTILKNLGFNT